METMGLISLGVVGSILPDLVRSVGFTLHMGVEVLVAAALPLLHTKAGQRLQQSKIKKAQLNERAARRAAGGALACGEGSEAAS
jgi:hypothetical protein